MTLPAFVGIKYEGWLDDAEGELRVRLIAGRAEEDVPAGGVDVTKAALVALVSQDPLGVGKSEDGIDGFDTGPHGVVRGDEYLRPLLEAWGVSPVALAQTSPMAAKRTA